MNWLREEGKRDSNEVAAMMLVSILIAADAFAANSCVTHETKKIS